MFLSRAVRTLLAASVLAAIAPTARGGASLGALEDSFRAAVGAASRATVVCVPQGVRGPAAGRSSGVIISADGLVLSDGDAGLVRRGEGTSREIVRQDRVEVRVARASGGAPIAYAAVVLARDLDADTTLLRVESPPRGGFPHVVPATSAGLDVGDFVFTVGSSDEDGDDVVPAATAGIVASVVRDGAAEDGSASAARWFFVSAAVNPGVNGGPLVDVRGRLVGTVSTYVDPGGKDEPFQFLGKAVPMDRILAALSRAESSRSDVVRKLASAAAAASEASAADGPSEAQALQRVFRRAGRRARPFVVSLEVERKSPVTARGPLGREVLSPERHTGPVSGVAVTPDGWIVTSLYNLTNVAALVEPLWRAPAGADVAGGLAAIRSVTAHYADGPSVPARLVGHDPRIGVALLKADLPEGEGAYRAPSFEPAPRDAYEPGRFVVSVGDPFGAAKSADPFLGYGILSKRHPEDAIAPWRGQWQADLGATDANCGGAVVDLDGRFVGMLTIWSGVQHGRNSGISFVVPWGRIQRVLPDLMAGRTPSRGRLGVRFARGSPAVVDEVVPGSPADAAGLEVGDVVLFVDRERTATTPETLNALGFRWAGDRVLLRVSRAGRRLDLTAILDTLPVPR